MFPQPVDSSLRVLHGDSGSEKMKKMGLVSHSLGEEETLAWLSLDEWNTDYCCSGRLYVVKVMRTEIA